MASRTGIRRCQLSADAARQRASALHSLHQRFDRKTEGNSAHDRRLSGRRLFDDEIRLRSARRRYLLVHGGRRLGDGAQLRRLRPARQRRDDVHVRRRAELAGAGPFLANHRAKQDQHSLHRADGDPRVHSLGRSMGEETRSLVAATARHGRRTDQSRSVDVVSQDDRRRALSRSSTPGGRRKPARS